MVCSEQAGPIALQPVTSLNGTRDFAFAADAPAADRLSRFYENDETDWGLDGGAEPLVLRVSVPTCYVGSAI